jgi:hypothetical protein
MADFFVVLGIVVFVAAMLGLIWGLEHGLLLSLSIVVFLYLGFALFKAERF